jgi:hypothetical protein
MSRRGKSSGKGFLLKLIIAALAGLAASAIFKKKVLAPAPATDYRLPSTPPPNPSAAMGPEESTPLTEQEKIRLQGSAGTSSAATGAAPATEVSEAAVATDEAIAGETGATADTQTGGTESGAEMSADAPQDAQATEPLEDETKSEIDLLEGFDLTERTGRADEGEGDSGERMGITAEEPVDALPAGDGFIYPEAGAHDCPEEYPIKGNASSRIFHRPGESSYDATIPEICFDTEQSAEGLGYRARKR